MDYRGAESAQLDTLPTAERELFDDQGKSMGLKVDQEQVVKPGLDYYAVKGFFEVDLGMHAKLALILSRRGVIPKNLIFVDCEEAPSLMRRGIFEAKYHASPAQHDSIVRELKKTVGVHGVE